MRVKEFMNQHGRAVELCNSSDAVQGSAKAFISPLRYKNKMYLYGVNTEIGYNSQGHYLYIGPPELDLTAAQDGDYIAAQGIKYRIDRAEKVYIGEDVFYIWAVVRIIVEVSSGEGVI